MSMNYEQLKSQAQTTEQVNKLLAEANEKISCGPDCQELRKRQNLEQIYSNAEKNVSAAPEELAEAEKNYYVYTKGENYYRNMMRDRYKKNAVEEGIKLTNDHNNLIAELQDLLKEYTDQSIYTKRMGDLLDKYLNENKKLENKEDTYLKDVHTSDRKTFYENQQITSIQKWNKALFIMYWIMFTVYALIVLIGQGQYKDIRTWITIVVFILFPFVISHILIGIKKVFDSINQVIFPRNVYKKL